MTEETKTITIDNVEYNLDDLSEEVKYIIEQINYCNQKMDESRREQDRIQMSINSFSAILNKKLEEAGESADGKE
jgi:prefoldin subunit 5